MDEQFEDEIVLVVKPRSKCDEEIEVRIKSITTQGESFSIEFASREDWNLFIDNYENVPVRMIFNKGLEQRRREQ